MCELTTIAFDGEEYENENEIQSPPFKSKETVCSEQGKCGRQPAFANRLNPFRKFSFSQNTHQSSKVTLILLFFYKNNIFLCAAVFPTYCCSVSFVNEKC